MGCAASVQSKLALDNSLASSPKLKHINQGKSLINDPKAFKGTPKQNLAEVSSSSLDPETISNLQSNEKSNTAEEFEPKNPRKDDNFEIEPGQVLFHLDLKYYELHYFQIKSMEWRYTDISKAEVITPLLGRKKISKILLSMLQWHTASFVNRTSMRLIGLNHFDYDVEENCFYKRPQMNNSMKNPLLAFSKTKIYAVSGEDTENEATKNFEEYDLQTGVWTTLEDLPMPHHRGSCLYSETSNSIVVIGGYRSKDLESYNPSISIFDTLSKKWQRIPLEEMGLRVPKLMNIELIEYKDRKILIFGTENQYKYYKLNLKRKKLVGKGNIPIESKNDEVKLQVIGNSESQETIVSIFPTQTNPHAEGQNFGKILAAKHPYLKWECLAKAVDQ